MLRTILLFCLLAFSTAQAVTYTDYDPDTHKGVLCVTIDDWVDADQFAVLNAAGYPVTYFIDPGENQTAARVSTLRAAVEAGFDIQCHTGSVGIDTLTTAELHSMFSASKEFVTSVRRMRSDWTAEPAGWTYYGNNWTDESQEIARQYFKVIRLDDDSSESPSTDAYPDFPDESITGFQQDPLPLVQMDLSRIVYWTGGCDSCYSGTQSADTTGMYASVAEIANDRAIAMSSFHSYDISYTQLTTLLDLASSRGDIWICTVQQLYDEFGTSHAYDDWGVVYCSADGDSSAKGTATDPINFAWAATASWGQTLQLADETYDMNSIFGVGAVYDYTFRNSMTIRGPATWVFDPCGSDTGDETYIGFDPVPQGDVFSDTYRIRLVGVTVNSEAGDSSTDAPIAVIDRSTEIDSCYFNQNSGSAIKLNGSNSRRTRITNCTFNQTYNGVQGAVGKYNSGGDSLTFSGNKVITASASGTNFGFINAETEMKQDSIMNNIWINRLPANTAFLLRFWEDQYPVYFGGNLIASTDTTGIIWLDSGAKNLNDGLDSLTAVNSLAKNFWTSDTTQVAVSDTIMFGGYELSGWSTGANHASIGPVQYYPNSDIHKIGTAGEFVQTPMALMPYLRLTGATGVEATMYSSRPEVDALNLDIWLDGTHPNGSGTWEAQSQDTLKVVRVR